MKKELIAGAVLIALFALSLLNIRFIDTLTAELSGYVDQALDFAEQGDFDQAVLSAQTAADRWLSLDYYTHICIRHSEINTATDAFYDLLGELYAEDAGSARGAGEKLKAQLGSIASIEHLTLGSIL